MFATGKYLKDKAANARRSATTLRTLADDRALEIADRGVLLAAAAIVERIASSTAKLGKERKASEEKYQRDLAAAIKTVKSVAESSIPMETVLEKVAVVGCLYRRLQCLTEEISSSSSTARKLSSLNSWAEDTIRELVHEVASNIVRANGTDISFLAERFTNMVQASIQKPEVISLANQYNNLEQATA